MVQLKSNIPALARASIEQAYDISDRMAAFLEDYLDGKPVQLHTVRTLAAQLIQKVSEHEMLKKL